MEDAYMAFKLACVEAARHVQKESTIVHAKAKHLRWLWASSLHANSHVASLGCTYLLATRLAATSSH
eukprot:scaffold32152_cov22-Tisochrysis_lutea.AAC.2